MTRQSYRRLMAALASLSFLCAPSAGAEERPSILFVGNSFTQGANSAVLRYRADLVEARGERDIGGLPALFARFAEQVGQPWHVVHVTRGGATLSDHLRDRRAEIDAPYSVAVLQEYSTLNPREPGNAAMTEAAATELAQMLKQARADVRILLMATWTRADQVYLPKGHWYGRPVESMARDVESALERIDEASDAIEDVVPAGEAWNRAIAKGIADPNPYDGRGFNEVDLWSYDQYHASAEGSYLAALTVFARVTGVDPRLLGAQEKAAHEIGLDPRVAARLQEVAAEQLGLPGKAP